MARSKGVTISVKVPIKWEVMTKRTKQRLRQIVGRDTRAIRSFLGIIEQHEDKLLTGSKRTRINESELDRLTMTALKVKTGTSQRIVVPYDMKVRFPRMSQNELNECRQTAAALYDAYLQRVYRGMRASRPCSINRTRRIPRWAFSRRFKLVHHRTRVANCWLDLRDSLDSAPEGRKVHDRLLIPLKTSPFHLNQFDRGEIKALQIFTDRPGKWWVSFAVRVDVTRAHPSSLPPAVLGIDLGIEKAACTTLVTPEKVRETKSFVQAHKAERIRVLDRLVASLQQEMNNRMNRDLLYDKVALRLRQLKTKRENVAKEYDRILVRQLVDHIQELSQRYTLYVAVGRLKYIRRRVQRGDLKGRRFRGMIHSWAFARVTESLKHQLAQLDWTVDGKDSRFRVVSEAWTSIICWKCGNKGRRPRQNYFICPTCGHKTNADRNGAINIAGRLITLTKSLHGVRGLGKWASAVARSKQPKTRGKTRSSRRRSLLSLKGSVSSPRVSAAVHHVQPDILSFGNKSEIGDDDPAVERTVERLSAAGSDTPASGQEKEARSVGGIPSH